MLIIIFLIKCNGSSAEIIKDIKGKRTESHLEELQTSTHRS